MRTDLPGESRRRPASQQIPDSRLNTAPCNTRLAKQTSNRLLMYSYAILAIWGSIRNFAFFRVRLSIWGDSTTSLERQLDTIATYARLGNHRLVPTSDADYDLDVSGAVSPFDRPGLGRWLKDDRLHEWDGIIVAKLDRLTRSLSDFVTLTSWLEARGKVLICLDPTLDLTTPSGRAFAQMLVTFAEYERETIAARVRDAWHKLRTDGQYAGGQVPFGYRPVRVARGWGYEPDPEYAPIVAELCERYVGHESMGSLTRWLNETGVPTPWNSTRLRNGKPMRKTTWRQTSVRKILASQAILGAAVRTDGTPVRDAEGYAVYRSDALVSRDIWERVQARLKANPVKAKVHSWPLAGVLFCAVCGSPMYTSVARTGGKEYTYYCCVHSLRRDGECVARRVKAAPLEAAIFDLLLALVGDAELDESKVVVAGRAHLNDMARLADQISHLSRGVAVGAVSGRDVSSDQESLLRAHQALARLSALNPIEARVQPFSPGQTFRERWESLDTVGRNELLRTVGVRAVASRDEISSPALPTELTTRGEIPKPSIVHHDGLHVVVHLGSLADLLESALAA